ncbi:CHY zinc finger [Corynebacterium phocae]|uniref:CHY zinc finger n=1 Tax=Corynebacterium phocae TaxID=161895 RepID=A0A1L7D0J5_9CORY|nr:CHY zinc finger protein [Corynebacterium phocae]APT91617.1 CHY zinc finger [Corynebacterium phocae]KAA8720694.1 hypothetical protein F4V58_12120 [Corynebacterium phocae]
MNIIGAIDPQGRCAHWHSSVDVVANKCATCGQWFACYLCHPEGHPFGPVADGVPAVMCGACGQVMTRADYGPACPGCGHPFNPGCKQHSGVYFQDSPG